MEGGTLTKDGKTLFGMLQSSIEPPAGQGDSRTLRLVRFDVTDSLHPVLTGEFVYRLDVPAAGSGIAQTDLATPTSTRSTRPICWSTSTTTSPTSRARARSA